MKKIINFQIFVLILLLFSISYAQKKDKVEVSPTLSVKTAKKKCKELDIGEVVFYRKPDYPEKARVARIGGSVEVRVMVDEKGNVSEILDTQGHTLLQEVAKEAALKAKFTPTICDGQVARIDALMIYNFIPYVITESYFKPQNVDDFADVKSDSEYYEPILYISENYNLAFGYSDKKFHSDAPLTRGDFVHFLRLTLDLLKKQSELANKNPQKIELFRSYNPQKLTSHDQIKDFSKKNPYSESLKSLISNYQIALVDDKRKFKGNLPITQNEVIDYWRHIFGKESVPVNFKRISNGDKILTRGEFSLFLQESLFVLTYKVLP